MSPGEALLSAAQLAVVGLAGWVAANLVLARALISGPRDGIGVPERALLAVAGFVALSAAAMVANIVTGGAVFGLPGVVPAGLALLLWLARRDVSPPSGVAWRAVVAAGLVLGALYALPVLRGGTSLRTGDIPWHMGWTEQLLAGEPVPTGPAADFGANAYPWGLHALLATMVRAVPSSTPSDALRSLDLLLIAALPLGGACLARRARLDAGWAGAAAAGLVGGFGWVSAGGARFATSPSRASFGADLVVASPNGVYELFPPPLPRELGLVVLAAAGVLLLVAQRAGSRRPAVAAGALVGLVGLVSVPLFASACLWALVACALAPAGRARLVASVSVAAAATFALWAGPVASDYLRYGGFVDITPRLGREWPVPTALASWGLLLPAAAAGALLCWRGRDPARRSLLGFGLGVVAMLALARARAELGWGLGGNATLLHQGRLWPVAHLLAAAFAGVALAAGYARLRRRSRLLAAGAASVFVACGALSPALASVALTREIQRHEGGFIYARADLLPGSFVQRAAGHLGTDVVVDVRGSRLLAFVLWQFSGVRLASYDDPRLARNDLRIRYRSLAASWDSRVANGGFAADFVVSRAAGAPRGTTVAAGRFMGRRWVLLRCECK